MLLSDFHEIEIFRKTKEAQSFSDKWIENEVRNSQDSDEHLTLLSWCIKKPSHALAIILNLIEDTNELDNSEEIGDAVGLGPVDFLITNANDAMLPVLREVISKHEGFSAFTHTTRGKLDA